MSYEGDLVTHYSEVRARLWGRTRPRVEPPTIKEEIEQAVAQVPEPEPEPEEEEPLYRSPFWKSIVIEVCEKHSVSLPEILSARRQRRLVYARHEAFYRLATETVMSYPQIGRRMGGRDHSTVIRGVGEHRKRMGIG